MIWPRGSNRPQHRTARSSQGQATWQPRCVCDDVFPLRHKGVRFKRPEHFLLRLLSVSLVGICLDRRCRCLGVCRYRISSANALRYDEKGKHSGALNRGPWQMQTAFTAVARIARIRRERDGIAWILFRARRCVFQKRPGRRLPGAVQTRCGTNTASRMT